VQVWPLYPSRGLVSHAGGVLGPGSGLVVAGVGLQAAVDPDEPVGQLAQRRVVTDPAGALTVVVGAGPRRDPQGSERLVVQRVDQPIIVDVTGPDQPHLARLASDRGRAGVVLARLRVGVPVGVVTELREDPGTEDHTEAGLATVD